VVNNFYNFCRSQGKTGEAISHTLLSSGVYFSQQRKIRAELVLKGRKERDFNFDVLNWNY
jgi:hypothetical protein